MPIFHLYNIQEDREEDNVMTDMRLSDLRRAEAAMDGQRRNKMFNYWK